MSLTELAWLVPLLLAVAIVLGVTGARGTRAVAAEVRRRFLGLTLMVIVVGVVIRVLVISFV